MNVERRMRRALRKHASMVMDQLDTAMRSALTANQRLQKRASGDLSG